MSEPDTEEDQHLVKKAVHKWTDRAKKEEPKLCPLLLLYMAQQGIREVQARNCLGEKCALYVQGHKDTIHPDYYLVYKGCGLISHVFWKRQKRS